MFSMSMMPQVSIGADHHVLDRGLSEKPRSLPLAVSAARGRLRGAPRPQLIAFERNIDICNVYWVK